MSKQHRTQGLADAALFAETPLASVRDIYAGRVFPQQQIHAFSNIDRLFPTRTVHRGTSVQTLPAGSMSLEQLQVTSRERHFDLYDVLSMNRVAALLVLKDSHICCEHYEFGLGAQTRWMSMSVAKSISSTLVGIAIAEGAIGSVDDPLADYLPSVVDTCYAGVSVRHLLQMSSGVEWEEEPTEASSHRSRMLELQISQEPGAILRFMTGLRRIAEPGTRWQYSTGETHIVGELLRAATGAYVADYASTRLWQRLGMEADASWWLESPGGLEVAGSGVSATLRDYARFGLFAMRGGEINGESLMPEDWFREATAPREIGNELVDYGYLWWPVNDTDQHWNGAFMAAGLFGQYIYVHPKEKVVIVLWSAQSKPMDGEVIDETAFFNAIVDQLRH